MKNLSAAAKDGQVSCCNRSQAFEPNAEALPGAGAGAQGGAVQRGRSCWMTVRLRGPGRLVGHGHDLLDELGLAHQGRKLRPDSHQQPCLIGRKRARLARLDDQHPLQHAAFYQGHTQEGVIGILTRLGKELEPWMGKRVAHHDGRHSLRHQAGQPLIQTHAHPADTFRLESDGGAEHEFAVSPLEKIDRANVRVEASLDEAHYVPEGLAGVVEPAYLLQC